MHPTPKKHRLHPMWANTGWLAACALAALPLRPAWAASANAPSADLQAWRQANEAVARFPRGHADVLKAESPQALLPHRPALPPLPEPTAWQRAALAQRLDLWIAPRDNDLTRRHKQQAVAQWSRQLLQAWWTAAAAQQDALLAADQHESASLGAELAQRMAKVGNWSEGRQLQQARVAQSARLDAELALQTAHEARLALLRMAAWDDDALATNRHPPPPASPAIDWLQPVVAPHASELQAALTQLPQRADWQEAETTRALTRQALPPRQWDQLQGRLEQQLAVHRGATEAVATASAATAAAPSSTTPTAAPGTRLWTQAPQWLRSAPALGHAEQKALDAHTNWQALNARLHTQTIQAWQRLLTATHAAQRASQEDLPTARKLEEDAQRRANGMLVGTWELLAAQRARVDAERAQVRALRDWHLAQLDWQAVQAGADPALTAVNSATRATTRTAEGH